MNADHPEDDEFPVGELWVDPGMELVRLPNGETAKRHSDWDHFMVFEDAISNLPLTDISEAFAELAERAERDGEWMLASESEPHRLDAPRVRPNVTLIPLGWRWVDVVVEIDDLRPYEDEVFEQSIGDILGPLLARWDASMPENAVGHDGAWGGHVTVRLRLRTDGRVGADAVTFFQEVAALLAAARKGPVDRQAARDLIMAGYAGALVGVAEGGWLDAKGSPYRLDEEPQRFALARDVSAFANAAGGLVILPAATRREPNGEVIDEIREVELMLLDVARVRDVVADWVFPAVEGFEVRVVESSPGRGQMLIHVPPQAPSSWPHIVARAELGDRFRTTVLAVCVRHDAEIRHLEPAAVQALLAAGKRASAAAT